MRENKRPRSARHAFGSGMMLIGAGLLAGFFAFKGWQSSGSQAAISTFETARAAVQQAPERTQVADPTQGSSSAWHMPADYSEWSDKRIREHEASLEVPADAPQAILKIGHLNVQVPVYNGADDFNLNRGVARIIGTGRVGQGGNLGIAGHRDGFFRPLKDIQLGDTFELETYFGTEVYRVSSIDIVDPSELSVLGPTDKPTVTLVTCYPFYFVGNAPQRFIVKGEVLDHQVNS